MKTTLALIAAAMILTAFVVASATSKTAKESPHEATDGSEHASSYQLRSNTSDWQTYHSAEDRYSIQVPADWLVDNEPGIFIGVSGEVVLIPPEQEHVEVGQTSIRITVTSENQSIRYPLFNEGQFARWSDMPAGACDDPRTCKIANTTVAGLPAVQYLMRTLSGDTTEPFYAVVSWFRDSGCNYNIEFGGGYESEVTQKMKLYGDILSTFRFLGQPTKCAVR
ncbi:PsbP-related protein [Bradyrhizobium elkanii]|uniref:Uncharacterized protein n=1 Tax=Bradyrhizobium elkanii TaxID=29448 RepID=A0ABV4FBR7_BRAEL|nr:PsbP-related protein [Bradyrhizobium elkanii]MCP1751955.1 hypothetical protein [Bradyrhizobium elkanii]MCP1977726.1 hypothetical protein [Bradyrhizobium elkanii]MCS3887757.1 hypothetical protein [Bradyrhizobium elkanii]MCS4213224.1 hypothetical protein [Bradyrhizobium elkanii]MCW2213531.1 hypothetical protein [Bradyrhizobium elkanii]